MSDAVQTNLAETPEIDWDHYDVGGKAKVPPQAKGPDGRYNTFHVQAPQSFTEENFGQTQLGFLKVTLDPLVIVNSGDADGYELRFQSVSARKYTGRDGKQKEASQLGNFLIAAEVAGMRPSTLEEYKAAVRAAANRTLPITIEWECYDKQTKTRVKSRYDEFDGPMGAKNPVITLPDGRRLVARAQVKNFITPRA